MTEFDTPGIENLHVAIANSTTTPPWPLTRTPSENAASVRALAGAGPAFEVAAMGHGERLAAGGSDALRDLSRRLGGG